MRKRNSRLDGNKIKGNMQNTNTFKPKILLQQKLKNVFSLPGKNY